MMGLVGSATLISMAISSLYEGLFVARFAATPGKWRSASKWCARTAARSA